MFNILNPTCCSLKNKFCSLHEIINALVTAIEAKDQYTRGHSDRVSDLSVWISQSLNLDEATCESIHIAAHLHDIGKIHVPDAILNKNKRLSHEEFNAIKLHPLVGYDILKQVSGFQDIATLVLHHHERWDGRGYPQGLVGNTIPLGSRIIAIADAIDAMMSHRPYREALSWETCKTELYHGSGEHFDPMLVPIAVHVYEKNYIKSAI